MLIDIFKNIIEQTARDVAKGLEEIAKVVNEQPTNASRPNTQRTNSEKTIAEKLKEERLKAEKEFKLKPNPRVTDEDIRQGLQKFKMDMMRAKPFYGDILMKVPVIEDPEIPTACTNGRVIRYNPDFFRSLKESERNFILLHEVFHILLLHWKRQGERDHEIWNIAADWIVNGMLQRISYELPKYVKFAKPINGIFNDNYLWASSTEDMYKKLMEEYNKSKKKKHFNGKAFECNGHLISRSVAVADLEISDEVEEGAILKEVRSMIGETIKRRGLAESSYVPREILGLAETRRLPWKRLLNDFLTERVDEESSYYTPERKYIHMDLIVPGIGKIDDKLDDIWAFVDTSGSINNKELGEFMTQLYRISKEFDCVFNIAFWDTSVTDVYKNVCDKEEVLKCMPNSSGGTDINCVYKYINENKIKPEVMLILTDGYFGNLKQPVGKLKSKTILVLSEDGADIQEKNEIGRLARL